jgi:hypothetical protein
MPVLNTLRIFLRPLIVFLLSAPVVVLLLSVQTGPSVPAGEFLNAEEMSRIEQLLLDAAPSSPGTPGLQELQLNIDELNLLLRYGLNLMNLSPGWAARLTIEEETLNSELSLELLSGWLPLHLNISSVFAEANQQLELSNVTVGHIQLPKGVMELALERFRNNLSQSTPVFNDINQLFANVDSVEIEGSQMNVQLQWDPTLISRISDQTQQLFVSGEDRERIVHYYQMINEFATTVPTDIRALSLNALFVPLFTDARERSLNGSDPIVENRTLLQALAIYVNDDDLSQLIGSEMAATVQPAKFIEVRLQRRQDLAQHVVSIAAITASAGAEFAELLSTTKEAYDARYRSGFSFSDLTANSVGVTLASYATQTQESALEMQRRMANLQTETDYMPEVGSNRDGISESDFSAIYSDRNSVEYRQRLAEIQALIDSRPMFQGLQ